MTEELATRRLTMDEARTLTEEVKTDAAVLWRKLLRLYEGEAHLALEYASWGEYYVAEFGGSYPHAYRLLDAGRVVAAIEAQSPIGDSVPNETVARELAPILRDQGPEAVADAWEEAVEEHGPTPTARKAREIVTRRKSGLAGVGLGGRRRKPPDLSATIAAHDDAWTDFRTKFAAGDTSAASDALKRVERALSKIARRIR